MTFTIPLWLMYAVGVIAIVGLLIFTYLLTKLIRFLSKVTEVKAPPRLRHMMANIEVRKTDLRAMAEQLVCPLCGASAGQLCRDPLSGKLLDERMYSGDLAPFHIQRYTLAKIHLAARPGNYPEANLSHDEVT